MIFDSSHDDVIYIYDDVTILTDLVPAGVSFGTFVSFTSFAEKSKI